jgi:hypothetical protein
MRKNEPYNGEKKTHVTFLQMKHEDDGVTPFAHF